MLLNASWSRQNDTHFAIDILKSIFEENYCAIVHEPDPQILAIGTILSEYFS